MSLTDTINKRLPAIARWMLVLFVLSWINLVIQAPVHAVMKQQHEDTSCHCKPKICDTVLSMEQQSDEALSSLLSMTLDFQVAYISQTNVEQVSELDVQRLHLQTHQYRITSPPPLLLKTVLLI